VHPGIFVAKKVQVPWLTAALAEQIQLPANAGGAEFTKKNITKKAANFGKNERRRQGLNTRKTKLMINAVYTISFENGT